MSEFMRGKTRIKNNSKENKQPFFILLDNFFLPLNLDQKCKRIKQMYPMLSEEDQEKFLQILHEDSSYEEDASRNGQVLSTQVYNSSKREGEQK